MKDLHLHLGRGMKRALEESANPSCCVQDKVERVRTLVEGAPAPRKSDPK
ncbi:MAG TPA: hypothetical protein VMV60_07120 [Thermoanaerobaculia bacterium]|nr:hypothetical protein [Thermoanaerobaculia bacterium]